MAEDNQADLFGVAVIGLHIRVPGAADANEFWQLLTEGRCTISDFSLDDLDASVPGSVKADPAYVPSRGVLANAECFDAEYFGIPAHEAAVMDPQQRLFLEGCHAALEDAGHTSMSCDGNIGVFAGMANNTYFDKHVRANPDALQRIGDFQAMLANEKDFLATRVAHRLDLKGPAISLYTGCSTSLVSVCQAFSALMNFQCDMALAGGVTLTTPQASGYQFVEGGIESPDGRCRPFDADASGTVFSNGLGVVALRRLEDAVDEGDNILAVIRGIGLNNDGAAKVSFAAPTVEGQAGAIELALGQAERAPDQIDFIEAHGTGTELGDPIEIAGLRRAFGDAERERPCLIGSVKSNFGHLVAASGVVGLIKTVLSLRHGTVPATVGFRRANPQLKLERGDFEVCGETRQLADRSSWHAGVSSFGIGGTNAHVLLESWRAASSSPSSSAELIIVSAKNQSDLDIYTSNLINFLENCSDDEFANLAFTMQVGRRHQSWRIGVIANSPIEAATALRAAKAVEANQSSVEAREQDPPGLLAAWLDGAEIDWAALHAGKGRHRISAPTYPFAKTQHWLHTAEQKERLSRSPIADERPPLPELSSAKESPVTDNEFLAAIEEIEARHFGANQS